MFTGNLHAGSNRADYGFYFSLTDPATNEDADLTGSTINVAIRALDAREAVLTGSLDDGRVSLVSSTQVMVSFSPADMSLLAAGGYEIGVTVKFASGSTIQVIADCELPVVDGVVP